MPIIRGIIKGIGSGIGMASEGIAAHNEKKSAEKEGRAILRGEQSQMATASPPGDKKSHREDDSDSSSDDSQGLDTDRAEWALDDAGTALNTPPPYEEVSSDPSISPNDIATSFINSHNLTHPFGEYKPLPNPVILPQRRPKDKSRGFVRGYAPLLGECSGIDQNTFIDFLEDLDKAAKASPVFDVINLACFAVGFIPNPIAMGVSIAVQVANNTAKELQSRTRRNTYLDQINETLFKPRGLYCIIMTFKPDNPYDAVLGMDVSSHDQALAKTLSEPDSDLRRKLKSIRLTSGVSKGELSLPESAPLVYPALDRAALTAANTSSPNPNTNPLTPTPSTEKKQSALKSSTAFMATYLDRRAQANYAGTHPTSKLSAATPPPSKPFASRFSDPNHPANSGTILGLLTGGNFDPKAKNRGRKAQRRAAKRGYALSEEEVRNVEMGRGARRKKGIIGRVLAKDVLYLAVVNLPSESEMREIRQQLDMEKERGGSGGNLNVMGIGMGGGRSRSRSPMR